MALQHGRYNMERTKQIIIESINVKKAVLGNDKLLLTTTNVTKEVTAAFKNKHKILFCGNGGSAADAQHLAAEFSGKFYLHRSPLNAEALHTNSSHMTAVANDFSYDEVFSRLIEAKGAKGDVLIGISTSGNSGNVIRALEAANKLGMVTVGMTGESGGKMKGHCKYILNVPSNDTPRIQEAHILLGHIICEQVEENLFGNNS